MSQGDSQRKKCFFSDDWEEKNKFIKYKVYNVKAKNKFIKYKFGF